MGGAYKKAGPAPSPESGERAELLWPSSESACALGPGSQSRAWHARPDVSIATGWGRGDEVRKRRLRGAHRGTLGPRSGGGRLGLFIEDSRGGI